MKLRRRSKQPTTRGDTSAKRTARNIRMGRSIPTNTSYSPGLGGRNTRIKTDTSQKAPTAGVLVLLQTMGRWVGVLALIGVIIFNSGLFSTGTKVRFSADDFDLAQSPFRTNEEYINAVDDVFARSKLYRSKLTFNSLKFEQEVRDLLPEVREATAVVPLAGTRLQVGLAVSDVLTRFQNGSSSGLLSDDGRLMRSDAPPELLGEFLDVPVLTVQPAVEFAEGSQVLTTNELELVTLLLSELDGSASHRLRPKSIAYSIETRELRVSFFGVGYYARLSVEREGRTQVGALVATLDTFTKEGITPSEYVDVRVNGRVFVK